VAELQRLLLIRYFDPSLKLDREATDAARERARRAVSPVRTQVLAGERIVGAHEQVREEELQRLRAYQDQLARLGRGQTGTTWLLRSLGATLLGLLILLLFGAYLASCRPPVYRRLRHLLALSALLLAVVAAAAAVTRTGLPVEAIPVALPALLAAALWDRGLALTLALVLSLLLAVQAPLGGASALAVLAVGGGTAALTLRAVQRRSQTWRHVVVIGAAYAATSIVLGLFRSLPAGQVLEACLWGAGNALASALAAMGLLPLLEMFTRITTDQTLLELGDLNRPLLRRLALEAPGTYAHSISVANLAEEGARAIGAHALLVRVGAYYHDVGKVLAPQYFVENQHAGRNPHDRLDPHASAACVRRHITEGVALAREYRLPDSVTAFIREHHGTQSISFFLERARKQAPGGEVDVRDFVYPGPKPQSRETALLMLADSVEAASRVLDDPTPERIDALVDRILEGKIAQGQLDESPLTLSEIARIKERFGSVLAGVHHHRIDYPAASPEASPAASPEAPPAEAPQAEGLAPSPARR
jgi:putative nucleotidyltransferase with HDIG domain